MRKPKMRDIPQNNQPVLFTGDKALEEKLRDHHRLQKVKDT